MSTSLVDADSMLVVDIGSVHTRAMLFDLVDGRYRFLAAGVAPTTAGAPYQDVGEGLRLAIDQLQEITGRTLVDTSEQLIIPAALDGNGVDTVAATISAGPPIKAVAVGLLDDVSLDSVRRLATTTYCGQVETISLTDRRKPEVHIDAILRLRPDMILVGGGTEGGASRAVMKLLESVGLACYLLPEEQRPELLFAGNSALQEQVKQALRAVANPHFAPNVRPALEVEQLDPAQAVLGDIFTCIRSRQIKGVSELDSLAGGGLMSTAAAFGRLIRFLSKAHATKKGVLGLDVGASATSVAAAFHGEMVLGVYPEYGLGSCLPEMLSTVPLAEILNWLPLDAPPDYVMDYLYTKSLYPASVPATPEDLAIELALARVAVRAALKRTAASFPAGVPSPAPGVMPWFEPLVVSGSVFTGAPSLGQAMLAVLDGVQPTGATTVVLDQNHVAAALGAAAAVNPILAVQVLDTNAFINLGTVVTPVGNARPGTHILRVKMATEGASEITLDVKQGSLEVLPLPPGQVARLQLQPLHRYDVGMGGPGRSGSLRVAGGALGVVIDARGRPIRLPEDPARRYELIKKWLWTLGG